MAVHVQAGVQLVQLQNGDIAVLLTPGSAVTYDDHHTMQEKVAAVSGIASAAAIDAAAAVAAVANIEHITPSPIFGIARVRTGGGNGLWFHTDKDGNPQSLNTTYFDRHPVYGNIKRTLIDGQIMNSVPKFYIKHMVPATGQLAGCPVTLISPAPLEGYHVHPAFMHNGQEIDQFYLGCYEGSSSNGTKLESVPGVLPAGNYTIAAFRAMCSARNEGGVSGFMMQSVYQRAAIQLLILAEYANPNAQSYLGAGNTNSSALVTVDSSLSHTPWRNFHSLYGNSQEFIDGINLGTARNISIWDKQGAQTYINTALIMGAVSTAWIVDMRTDAADDYNLRDVFIPHTTSAAQTDSSYGCGARNIAADSGLSVGDTYTRGTAAGIFALTGIPTANVGPATGTRLAKI